jgi:predicted dehydrogenase
VCVVDPNEARRVAIKKVLPEAAEAATATEALKPSPGLAIIASPPRFHAEQSIYFLEQGVPVLCEKPMAAKLNEAEEMLKVAARTGTTLAVGLFRRFYPNSELIRELVRKETFGQIKRIDVTEGGPFNWPAASASFFRKAESQGGVLADMGVHILDLLIWWFGYPVEFQYEDDAMGGLEANCVLNLRFENGIEGRVRLSRDTNVFNLYKMEAERGTITWQGGTPNKVAIDLPQGEWTLEADLTSDTTPWKSPNYQESFARQLLSIIENLRDGTPVRVPASEGILSLRLIEECYAKRQLMRLPWLGARENVRASELASA